MTVRDLIDALQKVPPDQDVVVDYALIPREDIHEDGFCAVKGPYGTEIELEGKSRQAVVLALGEWCEEEDVAWWKFPTRP